MNLIPRRAFLSSVLKEFQKYLITREIEKEKACAKREKAAYKRGLKDGRRNAIN